MRPLPLTRLCGARTPPPAGSYCAGVIEERRSEAGALRAPWRTFSECGGSLCARLPASSSGAARSSEGKVTTTEHTTKAHPSAPTDLAKRQEERGGWREKEKERASERES